MKIIRPGANLLFSLQCFRVSPYRLAGILILLTLSSLSLFAQVDEQPMPDDVAPPPLRVISREEKDQLSASLGVKDKATLYIDMLDLRLKQGEDFATREDFTDSLTQFGVYEGLLESAMDFLKSENKSNKALTSFKRLEITLRAHTYRIETVRREMPFKYGYHLLRLQRFIRKSRADATESLFSDSVVPEASAEKKP